MKTINFLHPTRKESNITKTFDLKHLGILSNSEKNNLLNFHNLKNNSNEDKYNPENQEEYNSLDRITNNETIKSPKSNKEEEKIKYLINNKAINNTLTGNYFFPIRKNYYSYSKFKSSEKKILSETVKNINENNKNKKETKEKSDDKNNNKNSNYNLYLQSQTIDDGQNRTKEKSKDKDIDKYDSLPKFHKNKKKDFKKLFIINKKINEKLNFYSVNTKSVKHHMTMQSTLPSFNPMLSPEKNNFIKDKNAVEIDTYRSISKKKLNDFNLSKSSKNNSNINDIKKFGALIKYRKNYPFILNPRPFIPKKFYGLPSSVIKMNNKYSNILKKENEKVFRQYFSIIGKEKFSKKFQNIVNKYEIKEKSDKNDDELFINENIISGTQLLKEINNEEKTQNYILNKTNKKALLYKFKKSMILLHLKIDAMTVYLGEILTNYKKPKNCYGFQASHDLFFAIKTKNYKLTNIILDKYKYIVLDYDYFKMTALHWAAKYNFYQIISKIVEYGSLVDNQNYIGDTPLLVAVKHKFMESTIFLLLNLASPFIKDNKGLSCLDHCKNDFKMKNIFKKIISLHYNSILGPTKNSHKYITKEFIEYIVNENKGDLELEAYNIIKEKYEYYKRKNKNAKS